MGMIGEGMQTKKIISMIAGMAALAGLYGCSDAALVTPETRNIVYDKPAPVPPGVVRYCWEEPMVQFEPNGPGLDVEGRWYSPSYIAVREVKQGRWRPCSPVPSEVKGETKNER
jgi:hypothetical protein